MVQYKIPLSQWFLMAFIKIILCFNLSCHYSYHLLAYNYYNFTCLSPIDDQNNPDPICVTEFFSVITKLQLPWEKHT